MKNNNIYTVQLNNISERSYREEKKQFSKHAVIFHIILFLLFLRECNRYISALNLVWRIYSTRF